MKKLLALSLCSAACTQDSGFTQDENLDTFRQNRKNTFDLLLVVDNSCSMQAEQHKLATNFDTFIQAFDGTDVDWQLGVVTTDVEEESARGRLIGGDDEIVLANASGNEQDRVSYLASWGMAEGQALALDPSWFTAISNDKADHWCAVGVGTPGAWNAACGLDAEGGGADSRYGSVLITEILADPAGVADDLGEWVELTNIAAEDVDLSGWHVQDDGRNDYTIPDGTVIAAGSSLVLARSVDVTLNGGILADLELGADFTLNNNLLFIGTSTEGANEIFAEMVAQGISGSGMEQGLEAARLVVTEPNSSTFNPGFVRPDANLNLMIFSDEEDLSPDPVPTYLSDFAALKGDAAFRDHRLMNVSAVVGSEPPDFEGEYSCESRNGSAVYGHRYVDAVSQTGGLIDSICDEDFTPLVAELGLTLSGLQAEFELSKFPDLDSLEVAIYSSPETDSKLQDLTLDTDYSYVEERNSIRFEFAQMPESETYIVAQYKIRSGG